MNEYIKEKIFYYCNQKKENNVEINLNEIYKMVEKDLWNLTASLYGQWINSQSNFVGVEFSKGSFEMVEYQAEKGE